LIDLDPAGCSGPAIAAVRHQPRGALQLPRRRSWRARQLEPARLRATQRGATRHRSHRRPGAASVLPATARLHINPLSVYFCHRADGTLALVIYEVRNTFGEIHPYVLPVQPGELTEAGLRQMQDKEFYVSPFVGMAMRYHFRLSPPGDHVKLRILATNCDGPVLSATFGARRKSLTTSALLFSLILLPFVTLKVTLAIHWEALRLWLKGARLVPSLDAAELPANTDLASRERRAYIGSSADR
jgi:uncharacterized protein